MKKFVIAAGVVVAALLCAAFLIFVGAQKQVSPSSTVRTQGNSPVDKSEHTVRENRTETAQPQDGKQPESSPPESTTSLIDRLKACIADGDWQRAKEICNRLASLPEAFEMLTEILLNNAGSDETDIGLRWRAAYALGLIGDTRAISVFARALETEEAREVRGNIVLALGMFRNPQARPVLESVLLNSKDETSIRQSAAQYLAQVQGGTATLLDLLDSSGESDLRMWAVEGLALSRDAEDRQRSAQALANLLLNKSSEDARLRCAAAHTIGRIGDANAAGALCVALRQDPDFRVRNASAEALGNFGDNDDAVSSLLEALRLDNDPTVRGCAAQALGFQRNKQALSILKEALHKDPDRVVRVKVVEALGEIGGEESISVLKDVAEKDSSAHVRNAAKKVLAKLQSK